MESSQELQHWGIKGQKWGVRRFENPDGTLTEAGKKRYRYQNPDGSLTEEGKKHYMTAAKKGKLDLSKLSDNDLNMINLRFAREKTFKQNIKEYEDSKFSNRLKKAVIDRVKGGGGEGKKSKGKGKGKGGIASILAMPIKKAFENAFKEDSSGSGGNDQEKQNQKPKTEEDAEAWRGFKLGSHFMRYGYKESDELKESRIKNGKRFFEDSSSFSKGSNRTAEEVLRNRRTPSVVSKNDEWWNKRMEDTDSWGWSGMRFDMSEYLMHGQSQYVITRSDELYHHGIKGQKWGVRRFENPDGTLTEAGKKRYLTRGEYREILRDAKKDKKAFLNEWKSEQSNARNDNELQEVDAKYNRIASGMAKSRSVLEKNAGHFKKADEFLHESEVFSRKADQLDNIISDRAKQLAAAKAEKMARNKEAFRDAAKSARTEGLDEWWFKNHSNGNGDKFLEHVWDTQGKLLDRFYNERDSIRYSGGDWSTIQQKYSKQLASNLGLPQTESTYYILNEFFFNGDD